MKANNFTKLLVLMLALVVFSTSVVATNVTFNDDLLNVEYVRINGEVYEDGESLRTEVGEELDIRVKLEAYDNISDVEISARLVGYEHADRDPLRVYDVEHIDEMQENDVEFVSLTLNAPLLIDKDHYYIRIEVLGRDVNYDFVSNINLNVIGEDNLVVIRRVSFDPAEVVAGRALRARVRLENLGEEDEDDVFVTLAIPGLGPNMAVTADVDELDQNELTTTEDLLLRVPECANPGLYDVVTTVYYDDGYGKTEAVSQIRVIEGECDSLYGVHNDDEKDDTSNEGSAARTVITPPTSQDVVSGEGVSFPLTIKNEGDEDRTYIVTVSGVAGWATADVSNPAPLVRAGETQVVYAYITANEDVLGPKAFTVSISDGRDSRDIQVNTNVLEGDSKTSWVWLYTIVIVLILILVIIALIVGLSKGGNSNNDEEDYY
jgi:uncharacterized membrane protein